MVEGGEGGAAPGAGSRVLPLELSVLGPDPADGSLLLLAAPDGTRFRLRPDADLRAALRRLGPAAPQAPVERAPLRPRDIQARIRGGESAAEVAEDAGVPVEQVRRYEGPVLAERAHVAGQARASLVRTSGARPALEDLVRQRLTSRGVDASTVTWDAWRREESRWAVQAGFRTTGRDRHAHWAFDPATSVLEPLDDEARWLTTAHEVEPAASGRRLSAVRVFDVEDGGQVREVAPPPVPPAEPEPPTAEDVAARTMDLLDALRDRRGRRVPLLDLEGSGDPWDEEDGDDLVDALLDLPPAAHPPASRPDEAVDAEVLAPPEPHLRAVPPAALGGGERPGGDAPRGDAPGSTARRGGTGQRGEPGERTEPSWLDAVMGPVTGPDGLPVVLPAIVAPGSADAGEGPASEDDGERPAARGRRRSSVPSWDDIVFGGHRTD